MTFKKNEYKDDVIYQKRLSLSGKAIKALEKMGKKTNTRFKPFVELLLTEIAENNPSPSKRKK